MADAFGIPNTIPVGPLGIIATPGCEELATKINDYLTSWRNERESEHKDTIAFYGYQRETFLIDADFTRCKIIVNFCGKLLATRCCNNT